MFTLPITTPKQPEKLERFCGCGKQLSYYNDDDKCFACQKGGKSMSELNELFAKMVAGTLCLMLIAGCKTTEQPSIPSATLTRSPIIIPEITDQSAPDFGPSSDAFTSQVPECFPVQYRSWSPEETPTCIEKMREARIKSRGVEMTYGEYEAARDLEGLLFK